MLPSYEHITDPILKRIIIGIDHKEIKAAFNLSDSEFQVKLDEVNPPKVAEKKVSKKKTVKTK